MFSLKAKTEILKHINLTPNYKKIVSTRCTNCLKTGNTEVTLRETFRFIKEKSDLLGAQQKVFIVMGLWIQDNQNNVYNKNVFTDSMISGTIINVCETYAELLYVNAQGKSIKTIVSYSGILYLFSYVINEYYQEYLDKINTIPPLCKDKYDENYQILKRLASIYDGNTTAIYKLILNGVLAGGIADITIARNIVIINELFIIPVTSINGFLQTANCSS